MLKPTKILVPTDFSKSSDTALAQGLDIAGQYQAKLFLLHEILKEGREQKIDLIVIASLGQSGMAKYFMGSVARNVLKGARCPVLLTK